MRGWKQRDHHVVHCGQGVSPHSPRRSVFPIQRAKAGERGAARFEWRLSGSDRVCDRDGLRPADADDADATAATAKDLGGTVLAGPFDAPWSRLAIINDPQGATFIAAQFVPENKDLTG